MAKGMKVSKANRQDSSENTHSPPAATDATPSPPTELKVGFIETSGGPERVLPPEIRDKIFRYLLVGHNVKTQRERELWKTKGYADYYCFEVNVLRVNKAIYTAAKDILYRENTFIVLSFKEAALLHRLKVHAVPIVSENTAAVDRFSEHSLFLRFEGPFRGSPAGEAANCQCSYCRAPAREKSMLLLSDDLPTFITICRVLNHMDPDPTFAIVNGARDDSFNYRRLCEDRKPSSTLIKFCNKTHGLTSSEFVEQTLARFRKVAGDRRVEIIAPGHSELAEECKKAMMPKVVWAYAIGWDLVEVARELKAEADKMVKDRTAEPSWADKRAIVIYSRILVLLGDSMIFRKFGREGHACTYIKKRCTLAEDYRWCQDWLESWSLLNLDMAIASVFLNLFSGTDDEAKAHADDAFRFARNSCHVPPETRAHLHHSMAFVNIKQGLCDEALICLEQARAYRQGAALAPDEGLEQDYQTQVKHVEVCDGGQRLLHTRLCLGCSSFAGKPCEARDSIFKGGLPNGIVGWQDLHHHLSAQDLAVMGVSQKDVPPRVQVEDKTPNCHVSGPPRNTTGEGAYMMGEMAVMDLLFAQFAGL